MGTILDIESVCVTAGGAMKAAEMAREASIVSELDRGAAHRLRSKGA